MGYFVRMNSEPWIYFTYEVGMIPWFLKEMSSIPRKHLNRVNLFGAGILAGVCMVMIIPEGAEQLFNIKDDALLGGVEPCQYVGVCLVCGFILNLLCDKIAHMFTRSKDGAGLAVAIGMCIHGASDGVVMVASFGAEILMCRPWCSWVCSYTSCLRPLELLRL